MPAGLQQFVPFVQHRVLVFSQYYKFFCQAKITGLAATRKCMSTCSYRPFYFKRDLVVLKFPDVWRQRCVVGWLIFERCLVLVVPLFEIHSWSKIFHDLVVPMYLCLVNDILLVALARYWTILLVSGLTIALDFFIRCILGAQNFCIMFSDLLFHVCQCAIRGLHCVSVEALV